MDQMMSYRDLEGNHAVVTAAGDGIGRATAILLASRGARITAIDLHGDDAQATADRVRVDGGDADALQADCTSREAVEQLFAHLPAVDILVNGVGSSARERSREFWESDPEVWRWVLSVSLDSAMLCARQVVAGMRERRRGKIVNISTDAALRPTPKLVDYAAAKAGILGFTRALAVELGPFDVNVNAVCPGLIKTRALEQIPASVLDAARAEIPLARLGEAEDIAEAIAFLASPRSRYITGQTLAVNGGRSMI